MERDRATAQCRFCDTDFVGTDGQNGGKFADAEALATAIAAQWPEAEPGADALVVFTGGEPCLQLDATLLEAVAAQGFETAVETNGTLPVPTQVDWICVVQTRKHACSTGRSRTEIRLSAGNAVARTFEHLDFEHFFLQPMDVDDEATRWHNIQAAIAYCLQNPQWRLSLQTHKIIGLD